MVNRALIEKLEAYKDGIISLEELIRYLNGFYNQQYENALQIGFKISQSLK